MRAKGAYSAWLLQQLTSGSFTLQIKLADDSPSSWLRAPAPPALPLVLSMLGSVAAAGAGAGEGPRAASSCYASARASLAPSLAPDDRCPSLSAAPKQLLQQEPQEPPRHSMCRSVKTVEALWREWMVGLGGQPSISALNSRWGIR